MNTEPPPDTNSVALFLEDGGLSTTFLLILAAVLILFSIIFSASESAFLSVNKLRIRFLRKKKNKKAIRAGKLLDNKERLINTVLVGNNIVNIAISAILTSIALELFGNAGVFPATIIVTIILLIFGEILPKTIGSSYPERTAFFFSGIITFFTFIFRPIVFVFTKISRFFVRIVGIKTTEKSVSFTEDEIRNFIDVGEEEGVIESGEKKMLHSVFKFTDLAARDIMIPRTKIVGIKITATYRSILELSQRSRLSRFPVWNEGPDDIEGILYIKDVLFYSGSPENFSFKKILREPVFIPETKKMSAIQQLLREKRQSLAIVLDEYSGTAGLLTTEDIAKELFGTLTDEYVRPTDSSFEQINDNEAIISGTTRLSSLSDRIGFPLKSDNAETIAGYMSENLDRIPQNGDTVFAEDWQFVVIKADHKQVYKVNMKKVVQE